MVFMRLGLQAAALVCVAASIASWAAGYPLDVALLRGVIAGVAVGVEFAVAVGVPIAVRPIATPFLLPGGLLAGSCSCRSTASSLAFANAAYLPASMAARASRMRSR